MVLSTYEEELAAMVEERVDQAAASLERSTW